PGGLTSSPSILYDRNFPLGMAPNRQPRRRRPMSPAAPPRIGFLGAGQMATALARGWLAAGLMAVDRALASAPSPPARQAFAAQTELWTTESNREVAAASDVLVLAVKPQVMAAVLADVRPAGTAGHLVVSAPARVTL